MKTKVLGAYFFKSKAGKDLFNLSVYDERLNSFGVPSVNLMATMESLPCDLKDMINKNYIIDVRYGSNGSMFAQSFYEVNNGK